MNARPDARQPAPGRKRRFVRRARSVALAMVFVFLASLARAGEVQQVVLLDGLSPLVRVELGAFTPKSPTSKTSTATAIVVFTDASTFSAPSTRRSRKSGFSIVVRSRKHTRPVIDLRLTLGADGSFKKGSLVLRSPLGRLKRSKLKSASVSLLAPLNPSESDVLDVVRSSMQSALPIEDRARDLEEAIRLLDAQAPDEVESARSLSSVIEAAIRTPADLIELMGLWSARGGTVGPLFTSRPVATPTAQAQAASQPASTPSGAGTVVLFVNGILTDEPDYGRDMDQLRRLVAEAIPGADVDGMYQTSATDAEASILGGVLCKPARWADAHLQSHFDDICRIGGGALLDLGEVVAQANADTLGKIATLGLLPRAGIGQAAQLSRQILLHVRSGRRVILLPHSQGNYFVRDAVSILRDDPEECDALEHVGVLMLGSPMATSELLDVLNISRVRSVNNADDFVAVFSHAYPILDLSVSLESLAILSPSLTPSGNTAS